jgi:hypothetical protein
MKKTKGKLIIGKLIIAASIEFVFSQANLATARTDLHS